MSVEIGIRDSRYRARIVWESCVGPIPEGYEVDHTDCGPMNTDLGNLRLATRAQNTRNRKLRSDSTTGLRECTGGPLGASGGAVLR